MKAGKSIEILYKLINELMGPVEAKNVVSDSIFNAISDLQEKEIPVTEKEIEKILNQKVQDYLEASKHDVA